VTIATLICLEALLVVAVLATVFIEGRQAWHDRAERAHLDYEVRRAERQLHGMASRAFESMLDAARRSGGPGSRSA
jgi:hypothetical protein